jgi:hypothetical protein
VNEISNFVFAEVGGRLRAILLVAGYYLCPFDEVWVQEACEFICVFAEHSFLFLFYYSDSPQLDESFLFDLSLLLLLGLAVLLQFDLPQFFYFPFVFLLFHAFLLSRHLV